MDLGKLTTIASHRVCKECGAEFKTDPSGTPTALEKFCDHITIHQFTLEQWTDAYKLIRTKAGKEA